MTLQADSLVFTGERFHPEVAGQIAFEHLHRYYFAREFVQGLRVLDVACGEGYGSHLLSQVAKEVVGVDIDADAVIHAREKYPAPNASYVKASAAQLPFNEHEFDAVVSFETIEHHDQHEEMMSEIKRVLKPEGLLIISSPDKQHYSIEPNYQNPFHVKELFREEFMQLIQRYFKNSSLLLQRVVHGSLMVADESSGGFQSNSLDSEEATLQAGLRAPLYDIIVASDSVLPDLYSSLFEAATHGMAPADFYGVHLPDRVSKADEKISVLESQLHVRSMPEGEMRDYFSDFNSKLQQLINGNLPAIVDVARAEIAGREAVIAQMQEILIEKDARLVSGAHMLNERDSALAELRTHVQALENLRFEYESKLHACEIQAAILRTEREGGEAMIYQLRQLHSAHEEASVAEAVRRENEWKLRELEMQHHLASAKDRLDKIKESTSWRLTKPLRWVRRLMGVTRE